MFTMEESRVTPAEHSSEEPRREKSCPGAGSRQTAEWITRNVNHVHLAVTTDVSGNIKYFL